jgi:hypothetical protein
VVAEAGGGGGGEGASGGGRLAWGALSHLALLLAVFSKAAAVPVVVLPLCWDLQRQLRPEPLPPPPPRLRLAQLGRPALVAVRRNLGLLAVSALGAAAAACANPGGQTGHGELDAWGLAAKASYALWVYPCLTLGPSALSIRYRAHAPQLLGALGWVPPLFSAGGEGGDQPLRGVGAAVLGTCFLGGWLLVALPARLLLLGGDGGGGGGLGPGGLGRAELHAALGVGSYVALVSHFLRVGWVAVPQTSRARRVNRCCRAWGCSGCSTASRCSAPTATHTCRRCSSVRAGRTAAPRRAACAEP